METAIFSEPRAARGQRSSRLSPDPRGCAAPRPLGPRDPPASLPGSREEVKRASASPRGHLPWTSLGPRKAASEDRYCAPPALVTAGIKRQVWSRAEGRAPTRRGPPYSHFPKCTSQGHPVPTLEQQMTPRARPLEPFGRPREGPSSDPLGDRCQGGLCLPHAWETPEPRLPRKVWQRARGGR